jgi:NADH-quinone oxidoreductase subunit H
MDQFTSDDMLRSRWSPSAPAQAVRWFTIVGVVALVGGVAGLAAAATLHGLGALLAAVGGVTGLLLGGALVLAAIAVRAPYAFGGLLLRIAFPLFIVFLISIALIAWLPAILMSAVDGLAGPTAAPLTVAQLADALQHGALSGSAGLAEPVAYVLWPLQFSITRDLIAMIGVVGFVSLVAMFAIWWERKVAGRMQSRLGPMRVGGWHGWAQSLADGLKLLQKEDIYLAGADRPLYRLAAYVAFVPAVCLFLALPFSAAWVGRDLDVGLIFIMAMVGVGVLGVLLAGWASNNKWSMYGAMREACQMVSYEIPLGFSVLVPVMTVGTMRLTAIGELQAGGFHTWIAFANPFCLAAALLFFVATLASCKRAPFDLPEAESELVAGFHTEYSGFRWALFFFAEYAEMFAVSALAAILFFGAWYSPLPASWGAAWKDGSLWQQALYGVLYSGPIWFVLKGFLLVYVQMWLRWTLPRIRIDQVMHACVQVLLPISMLILLGNTVWLLLVERKTLIAVAANAACTLVGVAAIGGVVWLAAWAYSQRRKLVGTMVIDHLPGA